MGLHCHLTLHTEDGKPKLASDHNWPEVTIEEFLAAIGSYYDATRTKPVKPITVRHDGTEHTVEFNPNGSLEIGCCEITREKLEEIYKRSTEALNE